MKRNPGKQILNRLKAAILALLLSAGCTVRTAGNETVVPAEETASPSAITETIPQEETPRTEPGSDYRDIRDICERSIKAGGLSEEETEFLAKEWQKKWDSFVEEELKKAQASESSFSGGQSSAG